jgi:zinc protease
MFAPLDDPSRLTSAVPLKGGETAEEAVQRLDAFVAQAVGPELKPGEGPMIHQSFGFLLGLLDLPDAALAQNPYGVALVLGRSRQLGLDPAKLKERIKELKEADLRRAAKEIFAPARRGAAVVTVKEP